MKERKIKQIISYFLPLRIESVSSDHNSLLEVSYRNGNYLLNSESSNYSFGSLHRIFKNSFRDIEIENLGISNCLLLGLGGGSVIHLLRKEYELLFPITAVEIDPAIIALGKKYFNLDDYKGVSIINADAFEFVVITKSVYDLVIVDLYINDMVPPIFHTEEFISNLKSVTHHHTVILFNKMLNTPQSVTEYHRLVEEMGKAFGPLNVLRYYVNGIENRVICVNTGRVNSLSKKHQTISGYPIPNFK